MPLSQQAHVSDLNQISQGKMQLLSLVTAANIWEHIWEYTCRCCSCAASRSMALVYGSQRLSIDIRWPLASWKNSSENSAFLSWREGHGQQQYSSWQFLSEDLSVGSKVEISPLQQQQPDLLMCQAGRVIVLLFLRIRKKKSDSFLLDQETVLRDSLSSQGNGCLTSVSEMDTCL